MKCKLCGYELVDEREKKDGICWVCTEHAYRQSLRELRRRGYRTPAVHQPQPWPAGLGEMVKKIIKGVVD